MLRFILNTEVGCLAILHLVSDLTDIFCTDWSISTYEFILRRFSETLGTNKMV